MTEIEAAYNQGVEDACLILESAMKSIPKGYAVTISGLADMTRDMRQNLTLSDPVAEISA
jgi:hypothetical protein